MLPVHAAPTCSVAGAAEIVGSKWTVLIIHDLSEGPRRFTELERSCAGISPRTLAERLRWLEAEEIVARQSYPESPPRVEYALTSKGRALLPVVHEMRRFGHEWLGCGVASTTLIERKNLFRERFREYAIAEPSRQPLDPGADVGIATDEVARLRT